MTYNPIHKKLHLAFESGQDYPQYREQINYLLRQNKTSGKDSTEELVHFTALNVQRMKRLDKTIVLSSDLISNLQSLKKSYRFLVVTEAWCGDSAQNIPILAKMAEVTDKIDLKMIYRDENPEIMDAFLTKGARSIPKLIAIDKEGAVLGTWGPRPNPAQEIVIAYKQGKYSDYETYQKELQLWYAKDKGKTLQNEFIDLLHHWENKSMAVPCPQST